MSNELREKLRELYDAAMTKYGATQADYWDGASDAFADALAALDDLADGQRRLIRSERSTGGTE